MMRRVALTGGIATGKTHVLRRLAAAGIPAVDADELAHAVIQRGTPAWTAIARRFGREILDTAGEVDRRKLGAVVFADSEARRALEAIIHPEVYRAIERWFAGVAARHEAVVAVADIPLLYETGHESDFDQVVVTACDPETQVRRMMARDGVTEAEARQRLAAQLPIEAKVTRADHVIRTDGTIEDTNGQVEDLVAGWRTR